MCKYSYLEIVGTSILAYYGIKLIRSLSRGVWTCFLANSLGLGVKWRPADNVWAVITGGTDGIGLEYAKQLAAKGYSIVIISRSEQKLNSVATSLKQQYSSCKQVMTIAVDFSRDDVYDKIANELNKLDLIDVLVNNVGIIYPFQEYFDKIPGAFNQNYLNVNVLSYIKMIELVLPKMIEQKRGIIINISSQAGERPIPLMTTYSATKAFVTFLSEAISVEYESKGIIIQTMLPSLVKTKLAHDIDLPFFGITPEQCVSSALKTVGIEDCTYGHWKHKLLAYITDIIASILGHRRTMRLALNQMKSYRDNYYRKNNLVEH